MIAFNFDQLFLYILRYFLSRARSELYYIHMIEKYYYGYRIWNKKYELNYVHTKASNTDKRSGMTLYQDIFCFSRAMMASLRKLAKKCGESAQLFHIRLQFRHRTVVHYPVVQYATHSSAFHRLVVLTPSYTTLGGASHSSLHLWVITREVWLEPQLLPNPLSLLVGAALVLWGRKPLHGSGSGQHL